MAIQVGLPPHGNVAVRALERLLTAVNAGVLGEIYARYKPHSAIATLVGLLTRVDALMFFHLK